MVVQKNKAAPIDVARLRPYLVHPVEVAWAVLPISLKKQVGTVERLNLYKSMFGPRSGDETTEGETTEPEDGETTEPETTEPVVTEPVSEAAVYVPSQPEPPEIIFTEPVTTEPETTEDEWEKDGVWFSEDGIRLAKEALETTEEESTDEQS